MCWGQISTAYQRSRRVKVAFAFSGFEGKWQNGKTEERCKMSLIFKYQHDNITVRRILK